MTTEGLVVAPGDALFTKESSTNVVDTVAGSGVYERDGQLFAAIVGTVKYSEAGPNEQRVCNVVRSAARRELVPAVGSIVFCKVLKVNPRFSMCDILCVGNSSIPGLGFKGIIRKENVRDFEIDTVDLHECFRSGDIVRAKVASLGSVRSYELSTAANDLGVIGAWSEANEPMVAVSFNQMKCPLTGVLESRKVANVSGT